MSLISTSAWHQACICQGREGPDLVHEWTAAIHDLPLISWLCCCARCAAAGGVTAGAMQAHVSRLTEDFQCLLKGLEAHATWLHRAHCMPGNQKAS